MRREGETNGGWTIPFIPIILVTMIALTFLFGWIVIILSVASFLLITAGVFVYDLFTDKSEGSAALSFWFHSEQELSELWELIAAELKIESESHDHENVWEWISAESKSGMYRYNISRKHNDYSFPVQIKVSCLGSPPSSGKLEKLGRQLAEALKADIKYGSVKYLKGNDYEFKEEGQFVYNS